MLTTEIAIFLDGNLYRNNSLVNISDIGSTNSEALLCLTNNKECCPTNGAREEWYTPTGTPVGDSDIDADFLRNSGHSVVYLLRLNNATSPTGVFRCEIPDNSGTSQNIYVGIYPLGEGAPIVNDPLEYSYDLNQTLTCTSTGGPATTVQWWKDSQLLGDEYEQQKRVINETSSKYQSVLLLGQQIPDDIVGNYTCCISNIRGADNITNRLHGELAVVTSKQFKLFFHILHFRSTNYKH